MRIADACEAYLRDMEARNLRKSTREGYESLFRLLGAFARDTGLGSVAAIDSAHLRVWREQWTCAFSTQWKRLAMLKAFFSFAQQEGWIAESPARHIRPPKSDARPTMQLSTDEMGALLSSAERKPKEQPLLLVLRYSGLAIQDAVTLERSAVRENGDLVLRRAKSEELVTVALPAEVLAALDALRRPGRRHYFWTGRSKPATAAKYWRERLKLVAGAAGVEGFHPHRLRDTFAVELLLGGLSMQDVSQLLGHRSVLTTERYHAPWNLARRSRLATLVKEIHRQDPILRAFTPKKPAGAVTAPPAEASLATRHVSKPARRSRGST